MMTIKNEADIKKMKAAGRVVEETLNLMGTLAKAGVSTDELNKAADSFIRSKNAVPSFLNYHGYPKSICTSVNEQVVHGIPGKYRLKDGDILSVDIGAILDGWHGDAARTILIGDVDEKVQELVKVTKECFFEAFKVAKPGNHIADIAAAVENHAKAHGYGIVRELVGHGIGQQMHESPEVPNFVDKRHGRGLRLVPGMTIAIEPMINLGTGEVKFQPDGWTVVTADMKPSAHYENTIAITNGDPILMTLSEDNDE